jgi:hypothetical protein
MNKYEYGSSVDGKTTEESISGRDACVGVQQHVITAVQACHTCIYETYMDWETQECEMK